MPRKSNAKSPKWTTGRVMMVGIGLMFVALFIFGGPLQFLYESYGPDWARTSTSDDPDAKQVDLSVGLWVALQEHVPAAATPVDIYDANMVKIETRNSDTTTGIVSFQFAYWEGETVFIQVYVVGNAATGATYMSPVIECVVPVADVNGDAQLDTVILQEPSSSTAAPTLVVTDQDGGDIHDVTHNFFNTTDTQMNILINTVTASTSFGLPTAVHDERLGFDYLAGLYLRIVTNHTLPFANPDFYWSEGTTFYYVWALASIPNTAANPADGTLYVTLPSTSTFDIGITAGTNCTVSIDLFDWVRVIGGDIKSAMSYMDFDTDFTVAAITTYMHQT